MHKPLALFPLVPVVTYSNHPVFRVMSRASCGIHRGFRDTVSGSSTHFAWRLEPRGEVGFTHTFRKLGYDVVVTFVDANGNRVTDRGQNTRGIARIEDIGIFQIVTLCAAHQHYFSVIEDGVFLSNRLLRILFGHAFRKILQSCIYTLDHTRIGLVPHTGGDAVHWERVCTCQWNSRGLLIYPGDWDRWYGMVKTSYGVIPWNIFNVHRKRPFLCKFGYLFGEIMGYDRVVHVGKVLSCLYGADYLHMRLQNSTHSRRLYHMCVQFEHIMRCIGYSITKSIGSDDTWSWDWFQREIQYCVPKGGLVSSVTNDILHTIPD